MAVSLRKKLDVVQAKILIVPGKGNSEPKHWQSLLEARLPHAERVEQGNWQQPSLPAWAERVALTAQRQQGPVVVVAHSFGCLATVQALSFLHAPIAASLLVAPADPKHFGIDPVGLHTPLPGVHHMVVSDNDPWLTRKRADELARSWRVRQVGLGQAGHINVASGFGLWPQAEELLAALLAELADKPRALDTTNLVPRSSWTMSLSPLRQAWREIGV